MDIASLLASVAPQAGIGGVLLVVLVAVMRQGGSDRGDYRAALDAAEQRHAAELERVTAMHDAELAELRQQLATLREHVDGLTAQLDAERRARWHAEDVAAQARRGAPCDDC